MAPIYDTDVEQERFEKEEWKNFELWEKIEQRLRKKRRLIIFLSIILFFILSSIPIFMDRKPYWKAVSLSLSFTKEILSLKKQAILEHKAMRLRFLNDPQQPPGAYVIERMVHCRSEKAEVIKTGVLQLEYNESLIKPMTEEESRRLGFREVSNEFCFSPIEGIGFGQNNDEKSVFAFVFVKDLTEEGMRLDRMTVISINNLTAEISFN